MLAGILRWHATESLRHLLNRMLISLFGAAGALVLDGDARAAKAARLLHRALAADRAPLLFAHARLRRRLRVQHCLCSSSRAVR